MRHRNILRKVSHAKFPLMAELDDTIRKNNLFFRQLLFLSVYIKLQTTCHIPRQTVCERQYRRKERYPHPAEEKTKRASSVRFPERIRQSCVPGGYSAMTPEPTSSSPAYHAANCPGVMPRCGESNTM